MRLRHTTSHVQASITGKSRTQHSRKSATTGKAGGLNDFEPLKAVEHLEPPKGGWIRTVAVGRDACLHALDFGYTPA